MGQAPSNAAPLDLENDRLAINGRAKNLVARLPRRLQLPCGGIEGNCDGFVTSPDLRRMDLSTVQDHPIFLDCGADYRRVALGDDALRRAGDRQGLLGFSAGK